MKVCTIGTGYVGLVTSACLAQIGHQVIGLDNKQKKIDGLKMGHMPIYEPGLEELVTANTKAGRLDFSTDIPAAVADSDICFITVGTPQGVDGSANMECVEAAAVTIAEGLNGYKVIVDKSTMPVGSTQLVAGVIREHLSDDYDFDVVSNPEFLREGSAVRDFLEPDRIVVGADSERAGKLMTELYAPINAPLMLTDPASAELIKYASNCFLAMKVSFINAMANICERVGADVTEVAKGMGLDKRIGAKFLQAGPGFGGSCFPKDVQAMIRIAADHDYDFALIREVLAINQQQKQAIADKVLASLTTGASKVAVLGLAFKAETDDTRDAPALEILPIVARAGHRLVGYDPEAMTKAGEEPALKGIVDFAESVEEAVSGADVLLLLTEWDEFKKVDWSRVKELMRGSVIVDARNWLDREELDRIGFIYRGVGR